MSAHLCDTCGRSVSRESDGYFCCLAPGMARISAKRKVDGECRFYRERGPREPREGEQLRLELGI